MAMKWSAEHRINTCKNLVEGVEIDAKELSDELGLKVGTIRSHIRSCAKSMDMRIYWDGDKAISRDKYNAEDVSVLPEGGYKKDKRYKVKSKEIQQGMNKFMAYCECESVGGDTQKVWLSIRINQDDIERARESISTQFLGVTKVLNVVPWDEYESDSGSSKSVNSRKQILHNKEFK